MHNKYVSYTVMSNNDIEVNEWSRTLYNISGQKWIYGAVVTLKALLMYI